MRPNVSGTAAGVGNDDPIPICGWSGFGRTPLTRRLTADVPAGFGREMGNRRRVSIVLSSLHDPGFTILVGRLLQTGAHGWFPFIGSRSISSVRTTGREAQDDVTPLWCDTVLV